GTHDYTLANGTITFAALDTNENISIVILDDALAEGDETIIITLSNPSGVILGTTTVHTHTIVDDEGAPQVYFQAATSSSDEDVGSHTIPVIMSVADGAPVTVDYTVEGSSTATGGGVDYTLANGTLTFAIGETVRNII